MATHSTITAQTGLLALFGHPVGHTLSPAIHNAAFRAAGLDLVYLAFDVEPADLAAAMASVRALGMRGVNVTVPHKEAVVALLDEVHERAARVGAVNTVVNHGGRLIGHNTDVPGFTRALRSLLPEGPRGVECLVIGAGGAARAVVAALVDEGAAAVYLYNRTFSRASALASTAAAWGSTKCEAVASERLAEVARSTRLLVNTVPIGISASVKDLAFPVDTVTSGHVVVDLVYAPNATPLVAAARARGALAADGKEMLVMQAAESYRLWTGLEPPVDQMRESVGCGTG